MSMVVCCNCKKVVWAYDHETHPIAGLMNHMGMVCPKCGGVHTFDGWDGDLSWEDMHRLADEFGYVWEPDGGCRWFGDRTTEVASLIIASGRRKLPSLRGARPS